MALKRIRALVALCEGNPPPTPNDRPLMQSFDFFPVSVFEKKQKNSRFAGDFGIIDNHVMFLLWNRCKNTPVYNVHTINLQQYQHNVMAFITWIIKIYTHMYIEYDCCKIITFFHGMAEIRTIYVYL